jgi:putative DNA primase/helicase
MSAEEIAQALGGRRCSGGWTARCPAHDDQSPSLSITDTVDGKLLVYCHAGCGQAEVIHALQDQGLWLTNDRHRDKIVRPQSRQPAQDQRDGEGANRTAAALKIWRSAALASDTFVQAYMQSRGLDIAPPVSLRFHPALQHPSGGLWPAMIALVTRGTDDEPVAIHRTFLARDGRGKAPVHKQKLMLGPCHGGAVRLGSPGDVLMIGEGIETCLAAMQGYGKPAWAALSTSGLRTLELPEEVRDVILLADGDTAGEAAAHDAAVRWKEQRRRVRIARPPRGMDFNDLLVAGAARVGECPL